MRQFAVKWFLRFTCIFAIFQLSISGSHGQQLPSVTIPCNFTPLPMDMPDINAPARGVEQWNNDNEVRVPVEDSVSERLDVYYRFTWNRLEASKDNYKWSFFDNLVNHAIDNRQKLSFGIISCYPDVVDHQAGIISFGNGYSAYPKYLHELMQSETIKDWLSNGTWVPNYNSENYLTRLFALNKALNTHIETTSYNGVRYKDVIGYIDVRGYGSWGEWHHQSIVDSMNKVPQGTRATVNTLKRIIDAHTQTFANFPLVAMISAFDADRLPNTMNPPEIADYILKARNNWGLLGWRRDSWGATDLYFSDYLENNTKSIHPDSLPFNYHIMKRWQFAPIVGEPSRNLNNLITEYSNLESQIRFYRASSFGNGNYGIPITSVIKNYVRAASKASGYRLILQDGNINSSFVSGTEFSITLKWANIGIAPVYEKWDVIFSLISGNNQKIWEGKSGFSPAFFLPDSVAVVKDHFVFPTNMPAGDYKLVVTIKDPSNYRNPLPLAIEGTNSDGSYTLKTLNISRLTSSLNGAIVLQGRTPDPGPGWVVPLTLKFYANGNDSIPEFTFTTTTDINGQFIISDVPLGKYDVSVKTNTSLAKIKREQLITLGSNNIQIDQLLEGDVNGDGTINIFDFGILAGSFNKNQGDSDFDQRADLNKDGNVNIFDFGLLAGNFFQKNETP